MRRLVIYDSIYGNTEKIARTIGTVLDAQVAHVKDIDPAKFHDIKLLIIGSPVHGGGVTPKLREFIKKIPQHSLRGINVTAFDTRFSPDDHGIGVWLLLNIIRYAAEKTAKVLVKKGGKLIAKPQGFIVEDKKGPLQKGEEERATEWAKSIKLAFP